MTTQDDNDLTQECEDLLRSLPKEKVGNSSHLYQYQGFWYVDCQLQGITACQKYFKAQDTDIFLVTTPKSGTTWLKAILFALLKRNDYGLGQEEHHPLLVKNPHDLVPYLDLSIYVDNQNPDCLSHFFGRPRLFATHLPFVSLPKSATDSSCKIVYLCRNPRDTFVSMFHFFKRSLPKDMEATYSFEDAFDRFCRGVSVYGPFWDHVLSFWKQYLENPHRVLFLKYEDLKENPIVYLKKLAEFLDCPFSIEEEESGIVDKILSICSFDNLSNLEVNRSGKLSSMSGVENRIFFRRGEVGDWKNFLTAEMADRLNCLSEEKLAPHGLHL